MTMPASYGMLSLPTEPQGIDSVLETEEPGLTGNFNILYDSRWLIGVLTMVVTLISLVYAMAATPVYEANLLIHVEEESPNSSKNILSQVSSMFETKQAAIAEMELLRSRMVIANAVDRLQLSIDLHPKYFPVIGLWLAERGGGKLSKPGIFGYGGYVWGAEKAEVSRFEVPPAWQNRQFQLTATGGGGYRLSGGEQPLFFDGKVGVAQKWPVPDGHIELRVGRLDAMAGAAFELRRLSQLAAIERIRTAMTITEQGKESGVIEVTLLGDDAQRINSVLDELGRGYIRQNLARKTEEAQKALAFLDLQLPVLKRQLEESEERYNQFRNTHGSIDMREEARMSTQQLGSARARSRDLRQRKTELLTRFNEDHPNVRAVNRQSRHAQDEIDRAQRRIKSLPVLEQRESRMMREIKFNTDLYNALANTAQQLSLIAVGRVSNVRLVDAPMAPERAIKPNRPVIVALGMIVGTFLGIVLAFIRRALNGAIDDQGSLECLLGAKVVYASIPRSKLEEKLSRKAKDGSGKRPLLAQVAPEDTAIESLRSFRTALLFAMPHFRNNVVMISGPKRDLGKSFVTANLAAVLAASGKRVLLIDGDLRNGRLQRYFGVPREPGLSNVVVGAIGVEDVIHRGVLENLDFIATGTLPPNRSELLLQLKFGAILEAVSARYDVVLIDPPPILAVADALVIGAHAGAVFILARAGRTNQHEIEESVKRLNHAGISPQGVLFNDLAPHLSNLRRKSIQGRDVRIGFSHPET